MYRLDHVRSKKRSDFNNLFGQVVTGLRGPIRIRPGIAESTDSAHALLPEPMPPVGASGTIRASGKSSP
jgi:hypothetical protein